MSEAEGAAPFGQVLCSAFALSGQVGQRWDFNVNLADLAAFDVDSLEGKSLRAMSRLYHQLGYASSNMY